MNVRDIVTGERYVVELAPRHPIRRRRLCTVVEILDRDNIRVTYEKWVPRDDTARPLPGGPSKLIEISAHAGASQFLYSEAERDRRIAREREAAAAWDAPRRPQVVPMRQEVPLAGAR